MSPASYQTAPPRAVGWYVGRTACHHHLPSYRLTLLPSSESGKRDSNPRPQPWQGCALPAELFPRATSIRRSVGPTLRCIVVSRTPTVPTSYRPVVLYGGEGNRTPDLVNAIHALSQLSYAPIILDALLGAPRREHGKLSEAFWGVKRGTIPLRTSRGSRCSDWGIDRTSEPAAGRHLAALRTRCI